MMKPDINAVSNLIKHLTELDIYQSSFSFYSGQDEYDTALCEEAGFFVPRELKGYIKLGSMPNENMRRTAHEVSHGLYLENVPIGHRIVSEDRQIAEAERHLFGRILRKNERLLVLTDRGIVGVYSLDALDDGIGRLIPADVDTSRYKTIVFLRGRDFSDYRKLRDEYSSIVSNDMENQEGFCTILEHKVLEQLDPIFAVHLFATNIRQDDVYGRGFRKLKVIESQHGLSALIDYLIGR